MTPDAAGRHCVTCAKTVIDFSLMADEAIEQYFIQHHAETICGRFKKDQLHRIVIDLPLNVFQLSMPFWKKFLVAALIVFAASVFPFETTIAGKTPPAFALYQDDPNPVKQHKKLRILKKKKHWRYRLSLSKIFIDPGSLVTQGFTVTSPPDQNTVPSIFFPEEILTENILNHLQAEKSLPGKKDPPHVPPVSTEFILPALLLKKRKNLDTPMD
jgi:hypothetical protein